MYPQQVFEGRRGKFFFCRVPVEFWQEDMYRYSLNEPMHASAEYSGEKPEWGWPTNEITFRLRPNTEKPQTSYFYAVGWLVEEESRIDDIDPEEDILVFLFLVKKLHSDKYHSYDCWERRLIYTGNDDTWHESLY
ncbi:MAG: hypothetical protein WC831_03935 [Parcubacteria group bacterium]|jgi:hypothetical protein